jgi:UDP-N-acetyl-D-mannosaminuronate dehydrogenase
VRKLAEMGAEVRVHDPYVRHWWEFKRQEAYPAAGHSRSRFFRNQENLSSLEVQEDLAQCLKGTDAVVLAVRHRPYLTLDPDDVFKLAGGPVAVIDCFGLLDDDQVRRYFELGCEVKGQGRGQIQRIKEDVRVHRRYRRNSIG